MLWYMAGVTVVGEIVVPIENIPTRWCCDHGCPIRSLELLKVILEGRR
jgi:hypothetical protein